MSARPRNWFGGDVPQRKVDGGNGIPWLPLLVDVGLVPFGETFGGFRAVEYRAWLQSLFVVGVHVLDIFRP